MDIELVFNELSEVTELLMVMFNYNDGNDVVEEAYTRLRYLRDQLAEEIA